MRYIYHIDGYKETIFFRSKSTDSQMNLKYAEHTRLSQMGSPCNFLAYVRSSQRVYESGWHRINKNNPFVIYQNQLAMQKYEFTLNRFFPNESQFWGKQHNVNKQKLSFSCQ